MTRLQALNAICDFRTGVYTDRRTQELVAVAYSGNERWQFGRCALWTPDEFKRAWQSEAWKKLIDFARSVNNDLEYLSA
jgi:hypothetical protein